MQSRASRSFDTQLRAIRLYCQSKLECNPKKNAAIGLYTMGGKGDYIYYLEPTSDVDKIMAGLHGMLYVGDLDLLRGITISLGLINHAFHPTFQVKAHKRLLFLVGGPTGLPLDVAEILGERAKRLRIAVDVVNFCPDDQNNRPWRLALEGFVSAANHKGNCHIKHIPAESSLRHVAEALSSSPAIIPPALMEHALIAAEKQIAKEKADRLRVWELMNPKGGENPSPSCGMKPRNQLGLSSFDYDGILDTISDAPRAASVASATAIPMYTLLNADAPRATSVASAIPMPSFCALLVEARPPPGVGVGAAKQSEVNDEPIESSFIMGQRRPFIRRAENGFLLESRLMSVKTWVVGCLKLEVSLMAGLICQLNLNSKYIHIVLSCFMGLLGFLQLLTVGEAKSSVITEDPYSLSNDVSQVDNHATHNLRLAKVIARNSSGENRHTGAIACGDDRPLLIFGTSLRLLELAVLGIHTGSKCC
ncbi:26S proteasome non-ATPase regulatory subunit 4 [Tanacetum coccineum]